MHSELQYTTTQYNTRYLMFNIDVVENLVFQPLNIIINNLNIVFYNYITPTPLYNYTQKNKILHPIVIIVLASIIVFLLFGSLCFLYLTSET